MAQKYAELHFGVFNDQLMKVITYHQWPTFIHNPITPAADVSRLSLLHLLVSRKHTHTTMSRVPCHEKIAGSQNYLKCTGIAKQRKTVTATVMKTISVLLRTGMNFWDAVVCWHFYNLGCKRVEFEAPTLTDTSTVVVVHTFVIVTDMAHGFWREKKLVLSL